MNDKDGRPLAVGDAVRIFSYYAGKIVVIQTGTSGEMAVVETRTGTNVVYPEEVRRVPPPGVHTADEVLRGTVRKW